MQNNNNPGFRNFWLYLTAFAAHVVLTLILPIRLKGKTTEALSSDEKSILISGEVSAQVPIYRKLARISKNHAVTMYENIKPELENACVNNALKTMVANGAETFTTDTLEKTSQLCGVVMPRLLMPLYDRFIEAQNQTDQELALLVQEYTQEIISDRGPYLRDEIVANQSTLPKLRSRT